jgi:hypothetical protein
VTRDIIGHESAEISRHYTHVDEDQKRMALDIRGSGFPSNSPKLRRCDQANCKKIEFYCRVFRRNPV